MKYQLPLSLILMLIMHLSWAQDTIKIEDKFEKKFFIGGRIMYDYASVDHYDEDFSFAGSEFRRARIESFGEISENIGFNFQVEFATAVVRYKAMNIYFKDLPIIGGKLSVGNINNPFNLDLLTSSKYITFIERATPESYMLKWHTGFLYENTNLFQKKIGIQLAYTANSTGVSGVNLKLEDGQNISGRLTAKLLQENQNNQLLHLGLSFNHITPVRVNENSTREYLIAVRPEAHLAKVSLFHVFDDAKNVQITAFEGAYTYGPFSVQGEFVYANIATNLGDYVVPSYYGYVSYFITGDHRPYDYKANTFDRVRPIDEVNFKDKWGAIELAARYSSFDLTEADKGKLNNITLGMNWYLNSQTRIMYNYILSDDQGPEKVNIHMLRFQIDFGKSF